MPVSPAVIVRAAGSLAVVGVARREVRRDDVVVHLTPKAFDLLVVLIGEAPRVVPKPELHQRLWPGTFVSDATLVGLVKEIRRELGDRDPGAPIIRTAHRVGYAFCPRLERAPTGQLLEIDATQEDAASVCHWLMVSGRRIALRDGENSIGRDPSSNVWLDSASVSRAHARIVVGRDGVSIEDCQSKNGTKIGRERVTTATGGRLMFVSRRPNDDCGMSAANIYETRLDPALVWLPPVILPCTTADDVNSFADEFSPSLVEAEGRSILFFSSGRDGVQRIYTTELDANGAWGPVVAVDELNSGAQDARPNVSRNGLEIVFHSTRDGGVADIWTATRTKLSKPWSAPRKLTLNVNSDAAESRPSLSRDGRRLYFGSTRQGTQSDIYVSTRLLPPGLRN